MPPAPCWAVTGSGWTYAPCTDCLVAAGAGPDGHRVLLESAKGASGGRITTRLAVERFLRKINGLDASGPSPKDLDRAHIDATRRLQAAGF